MRTSVLALSAAIVASAPARGQAQAPSGAVPPCRTTALVTIPQLFTQDGSSAAGDSPTLLERFYIAVSCDAEHDAGDYQIWWKSSLTSPATSARLVTIIDAPAAACSVECPGFDFYVEVNNWRMVPGCYGVKGIYGNAIDEYWQCTRAVVYTLSPERTAAPNRE